MPKYTPVDAAQFINAQMTRAYKIKAYEFFKQKHGVIFANQLKNLLKAKK
jgi:hypothetical protein